MPFGRRLDLRHVHTLLPRLRTVCRILLALVTLLTIAACLLTYYILFHHALPIRRAYYLETAYLYAMRTADLKETMHSKTEQASTKYPLRVRGLIEDAPQLHHWRIHLSRAYDGHLGLWYDGTGQPAFKRNEYWIYFGGTPSTPLKSRPFGEKDDREGDPTVFRHRYKKTSCNDPPRICFDYNEAFNRISARWHGAQRKQEAHPANLKAYLQYIDCDISPLLCSAEWGLNANPVMLAHMKIGDECDRSIGVERCPVTWRFISLPVRNAPWTRQVRVELDQGGSTVVPAFPDAEEQMWTLMTQAGAEEGLEYSQTAQEQPVWNALVTVTPIFNEEWAQFSFPLGLFNWAILRTYLDYPLGWPRERLIRCYAERWLDLLLRWWDGPPSVAMPRSCVAIEDKHEKYIRKMMKARDMIDHGMDPTDLFVE